MVQCPFSTIDVDGTPYDVKKNVVWLRVGSNNHAVRWNAGDTEDVLRKKIRDKMVEKTTGAAGACLVPRERLAGLFLRLRVLPARGHMHVWPTHRRKPFETSAGASRAADNSTGVGSDEVVLQVRGDAQSTHSARGHQRTALQSPAVRRADASSCVRFGVLCRSSGGVGFGRWLGATSES